MGLINIEDVQAGMVLSDDVKDDNGRVLLGGGTEITEKHLKIFKMWGITEADIEGKNKEDVDANCTSDFDPALLKEVEYEALDLFKHADIKNPVIIELMRLFTVRRIKGKAAGQEHEIQ